MENLQKVIIEHAPTRNATFLFNKGIQSLHLYDLALLKIFFPNSAESVSLQRNGAPFESEISFCTFQKMKFNYKHTTRLMSIRIGSSSSVFTSITMQSRQASFSKNPFWIAISKSYSFGHSKFRLRVNRSPRGINNCIFKNILFLIPFSLFN